MKQFFPIFIFPYKYNENNVNRHVTLGRRRQDESGTEPTTTKWQKAESKLHHTLSDHSSECHVSIWYNCLSISDALDWLSRTFFMRRNVCCGGRVSTYSMCHLCSTGLAIVLNECRKKEKKNRYAMGVLLFMLFVLYSYVDLCGGTKSTVECSTVISTMCMLRTFGWCPVQYPGDTIMDREAPCDWWETRFYYRNPGS